MLTFNTEAVSYFATHVLSSLHGCLCFLASYLAVKEEPQMQFCCRIKSGSRAWVLVVCLICCSVSSNCSGFEFCVRLRSQLRWHVSTCADTTAQKWLWTAAWCWESVCVTSRSPGRCSSPRISSASSITWSSPPSTSPRTPSPLSRYAISIFHWRAVPDHFWLIGPPLFIYVLFFFCSC